MAPPTPWPWTTACGRCSRASARRSWRTECMRRAPSFRTGGPVPSCWGRWTGQCTKRWPSLRPGYQDQSPEAHEQPRHMARGEVLPVADDPDDHQQERGGDVGDDRCEADAPPGTVSEQYGELHSHD